MDKKNNDGKTFSDIFSTVIDKDVDNNSLKEGVSGNNDKTFNSIFDKVTQEKNEEEKSFSDIFDKVENNEKIVKEDTVFNEIIKKDNNNEKKTFSDIFDKVDDDNSKLDTDNIDKGDTVFDKVDDDNIEVKESFSDVFDKVNNDKENVDGKGIINEVVHEENKNEELPKIFDKNDPIAKVLENESVDEKDSVTDEKVHEDDKEEIKNDVENKENLFFSNDTEKEVVSNKDDVNPFFDKVEEDNNNVNPFFDNKLNLVEEPEYSNKDVNGKINLNNVQNFDVKIRKKKPNLLQAIIGVLSYALFIWLLLIGVALLVYVLDIKIRAVKGDNSPPKYGAYVVLTGSMLPEIQVYDVVVTKQQDAKDLKEGDVITFASSDTRFAGTIITHRIIKKNYNSKTKSYTFQTKGDNNNVADSALVSPNDIFGKVILKIPKLGYLRDFLASDGGWILVVLFPCLAVVAYDIVKIGKGLKRKKYKNIIVQSR